MLLRVQFEGEQKYVKLSELTFSAFLKEVLLKFNIPERRQLDMKVYDQSNTEVDSEVFEEIAKESPGTFRATLYSEELGTSQSSSSSVRSDGTVALNLTVCDPHEEAVTFEEGLPKRLCRINCKAKVLIENVLSSKPGGERIIQEYGKNKTLTDATRRQMINILAAEMTETHGTSPPKSVRVMYAQGIVALFPNLEDPYSQHGYEHYYDPENGSGYLAWRLKTIQRKPAEERGASGVRSPKGWDSDMSALLLLLHLLPPSAQGRKRPGKMSASQAGHQLIRFQKVGTSVQQHLDSITQSRQPYLLAMGSTKCSIHSYFIVIDNHALPCKATGSVGAFDELFKAHFVFGTSYNSCLNNVFTFVQTTIYNIDIGETKETPRVAELRAKMMC
ncbi:uncharacterized protein [Hoplias malabaricus]|uniref:uncharacterized protein n=1 Tax=Hoplias malabaricus TaxID=27720 RepID=UPI0034628A78